MKKTFAIITIDEQTIVEPRIGDYSQKKDPISILRIIKFLGIPIFKVYATQEEYINKIINEK